MKRKMGILSSIPKSLKRIYHFPINQLDVFNLSQPNSKEANILFLGQDMDCKKAVKSNISYEVSSEYSTSWEFSFGEIKFKFFDLGEHRIAHRAWCDYGAKMDGVVYVLNDDALTEEELLGPREEMDALIYDEAFAEVPVLIFGVTSTGALCQPKERLCFLLKLPNDTIAHPLKVFVAEEYLDGFKWLSRYIK